MRDVDLTVGWRGYIEVNKDQLYNMTGHQKAIIVGKRHEGAYLVDVYWSGKLDSDPTLKQILEQAVSKDYGQERNSGGPGEVRKGLVVVLPEEITIEGSTSDTWVVLLRATTTWKALSSTAAVAAPG